MCVNALANQVVLSGDNFVFAGGLHQRACGSGERLTHCTDDGCDKRRLAHVAFVQPGRDDVRARGSGCAACDPELSVVKTKNQRNW